MHCDRARAGAQLSTGCALHASYSFLLSSGLSVASQPPSASDVVESSISDLCHPLPHPDSLSVCDE